MDGRKISSPAMLHFQSPIAQGDASAGKIVWYEKPLTTRKPLWNASPTTARANSMEA